MQNENLERTENSAELVEKQQSTGEIITKAIQALDWIPVTGTQHYGNKPDLDELIKNALSTALPYLEQLTKIYPDDQNLANLYGRTEQYIKGFDSQGYQNFTSHANETISYLLHLQRDRKKEI